MTSSIIADIIGRYVEMKPGDYNLLARELTRLETTVRDMGSVIGPSGHITRAASGNMVMGSSEGFKLFNPDTGRWSIDLQPDGDALFGSDTASPAATSLVVISNPQKYNGESLGAGDLLIGDNTAGAANLLWDRSTGRLNFRGGTTAYAYIGTDGKLVATDATLSGTITAAAGSIGGWTINATNIKKTGIVLDSSADAIYVGASAPRLLIDGANKVIQSSNFASGISGFSVSGATGNAEFNNITARGEIRTAVLAYGQIHATAGTQGVFKSAGRLRVDTQTVTTPAQFTMEIDDPEVGHMQLFAVNDILRTKDISGSNWMRVDSVVNLGSHYRYTVSLMAGTPFVTIRKGAAVVDYGPAGTGFITLSADGTVGSSANLTIATHAGSPWSTQTALVRLGNLNGSYGIASDYYGIGLGDYSGGNYLRYDTNSGFTIRAGGNKTLISASGLWVADAGGDAVLGVSCADGRTWGGKTLNTGDLLFGNSGSGTGGWAHFDRDGSGGKGILTIGYGASDVINFKSTGAEISGTVSVTGSITAGGGDVLVDASGVSFLGDYGDANAAKWYAGSAKIFDIQSAPTASNEYAAYLVMPSITGSLRREIYISTDLVAGPTIQLLAGAGTYITGPLFVDGRIALKDGSNAPAAVSGSAILYVDVADGDLKVRFGDGTIKTIVTDT